MFNRGCSRAGTSIFANFCPQRTLFTNGSEKKLEQPYRSLSPSKARLIWVFTSQPRTSGTKAEIASLA